MIDTTVGKVEDANEHTREEQPRGDSDWNPPEHIRSEGCAAMKEMTLGWLFFGFLLGFQWLAIARYFSRRAEDGGDVKTSDFCSSWCECGGCQVVMRLLYCLSAHLQIKSGFIDGENIWRYKAYRQK